MNQEFRLEQFEEALHHIIGEADNKHIKERLKQFMANGHIPQQIRDEFNLPQDMRNRDVDFYEVRIMDSLSSIKYPVWSGQDVLATSMNCEQAESVTNKLNTVRVWPKDHMNIIKKIRAVLKLHCLNPLFEHFMTFCVFINTVVMSMDRYGIEPELESILNSFN